MSDGKCPSCKRPLAALATVCPSCRHELTDLKANRTVVALAERFESIEKDLDGPGLVERNRQQAVREKKGRLIRDFPIPNVREDLLSLLFYIHPKLMDSVHPDLNVDDWRIKFMEVLNRAKRAYQGDEKTLAEIDAMEKSLQRSLASGLRMKAKRSPLIALAVAASVIASVAVVFLLHNQSNSAEQCEHAYEVGARNESDRLAKIFTRVEGEFKAREFDDALMNSAQLRWEYNPSCKQADAAKAAALWVDKRTDIVAAIRKGIESLAAEKSAAEARMAAEKNTEMHAAVEHAKAQDEFTRRQAATAATDSRNAAVANQY